MKKIFAVLPVAIFSFLLFAVSVRAASLFGEQIEAENPVHVRIYSGVLCSYSTAFDEIRCGLLPLKQAIGLLREHYIEPLDFAKLAETAIAAGMKHIAEFSYDAEKIKSLDVPSGVLEGTRHQYPYYELGDWEWRKITHLLRPLTGALAEARYRVEKIGPRAFELLVQETRDIAIRTIVAGLDPHTAYFPLAYDEGEDALGGIGVALGNLGLKQDPYVKMSFSGMPAGDLLERYDEIITVDGVSVQTAEQAVTKIRGIPETNVTLSVRRNGEMVNITLLRKKLDFPAASGKLYVLGDVRVCYVFTTNFSSDIDKKAKALFDDGGACSSANTYALDLRGNSGGDLFAAIEMVQMFLPRTTSNVSQEVLVRLSGKSPQVFTREAWKAMRAWKYRPVILIDGASASASEVAAGALGPYATRIGVRTFGKSAVMRVFTLADGSLFMATWGAFSFRDGASLLGRGVFPDVYFNRNVFYREVPKEPLRREENNPRYRGKTPSFTDEEKLLMFLSDRDPELAIALSLMAHQEISLSDSDKQKGEIQ